MKKENKLIRTIKASILCARFPFLYPRNRWDGKHHAYKLNNLRYKLHEKAIQEIGITGKLDKEEKQRLPFLDFFDISVKLDKKNKKLIIKNKVEIKEHDIKSLLWNDDRFEILGLDLSFGLSGRPNIVVCVKTKDETDNANYGFHYETVELLKNKSKHFLYKAICWIDEKILDKIFIIPTHTELDAMPEGWRNKFGIQMCKEIKQSLLKTGGRKALKSYRIVQIKEKFGGLRWYDAWSTDEILHTIIPKYEKISFETCIHCGKPAQYVSAGYISPYCEDCIDDKHNYVPIIEEGAWDKAYTYYWPKKEE